MNIIPLIQEINDAGIQLYLDPEQKLKFRAKPAAMTQQLRQLIGEHKAEIIGFLRSGSLQQKAMPARDPLQPALASSEQKRMWLMQNSERMGDAYHLPAVFELLGQLDKTRLADAFLACLERHVALRTRLQYQNEQLLQTVLPADEFKVQYFDARQDNLSLESIKEQILFAEFDLSSEFPVRFGLVTLDEQRHLMLLNFHHIASDGWSKPIFLEELSEFYNAEQNSDGSFPALSELTRDYRDYASWQKSWLDSDKAQQDRLDWQTRLAEAPEVHNLPIRDISGYKSHPIKGEAEKHFSPEQQQQIQQFCQSQQVTVFQFLLAVLGFVVSRYSNESKVVIGSPVANREQAEIQKLVGYFANTLLFPLDVDKNLSFISYLNQVKAQSICSFKLQQLPFEQVVEQLSPQRHEGINPLFQIMFAHQNNPRWNLELNGIHVLEKRVTTRTSQLDIKLETRETPKGLTCLWEFNRNLFDQAFMDNLATCYVQVVTSLLNNASQTLSEVVLFTDADAAKIGAWNQFHPQLSAQQLSDVQPWQQIVSHAERTPNHIALRCAETQLSYQQLQGRVDQLCLHIRESGVKAGQRLGLCLTRNCDLVATVIAMYRLGVAYVPLDPAYPAERLQLIAGSADLSGVLCDVHTQHQQVHSALDLPVINVSDSASIATRSTQDTQEFDASLPAYIIYTSGSTGTPKGVVICRQNLHAFLAWTQAEYGAQQLKQTLFGTSINFDLSIFEMWAPLLAGGTVNIANNILALSGSTSAQKLANTSLLNTVPSALRTLLDNNLVPDSVETINVAGEPLPKELVNKVFASTKVQKMYNLYGPSEDTTYSTYQCFTGGIQKAPDIGYPLPGTEAFVVNQEMQLQPVGCVGELVLTGKGLSSGYLNKPELTAEKFVDVQIQGMTRKVYRTGDLVCYGDKGQMIYCGRTDHQVKLRGFRIELSDIENNLRRHADIDNAVVVLDKNLAEEGTLVAYCASSKALTASELSTWLERKLPGFMVPEYFEILDSLPLNANGKVDRKALPAITVNSPAISQKPETLTKTQQIVWDLFASKLQKRDFSASCNFFSLGGNSLKSVSLVVAINQAFGTHLSVSDIFTYPSVEAIATYVEFQQTRQQQFNLLMDNNDEQVSEQGDEIDLDDIDIDIDDIDMEDDEELLI